MAKLNRFIIDSDVEAMKIVGIDNLTMTLQAYSIPYTGGSSRTVTQTITVPSGVYFDISSVKTDWVPGVVPAGIPSIQFSKAVDSAQYPTKAVLEVTVKKTSSTQYVIEAYQTVQWGGSGSSQATVNFPKTNITAKLVRLVPSSQQ